MHTTPLPATSEADEFFLGSNLTQVSAMLANDETVVVLSQRELDRRKLNTPHGMASADRFTTKG